MTRDEIAKVAKGLTAGMSKAIQDCPGNQEYCQGHLSSMAAIEYRGLIFAYSAHSTGGKRRGRLTPAGIAVRDFLRGEDHG